jgi:hypothetical protein
MTGPHDPAAPEAAPTLAEFLAAPPEQVAQIAPATLVYTPGGTRRQAALAGIDPRGEGYVRWGRERMIASFTAIFETGVRHLFTGLARASQFAEVGAYGERMQAWLEWVLLGPEARADWRRYGWRVRLLGGQELPAVRAIADRLAANTAADGAPTVWCCLSTTPDALWATVLDLAHRTGARTQAEIVRAVCGEDIPPAPLWISSGKPTLAPDLLPFLVTGEAQCYWMQQPGYALDAPALRHILYDCTYLRHTWLPDKSARYEGLAGQQAIWRQPYVLGLGQRLGPFWYPSMNQDARGEPT